MDIRKANGCLFYAHRHLKQHLIFFSSSFMFFYVLCSRQGTSSRHFDISCIVKMFFVATIRKIDSDSDAVVAPVACG